MSGPVKSENNNKGQNKSTGVPLSNTAEIGLLIVLKLCYVVLGHSEVGEKLQRVACRGEVVDRNFVSLTRKSSSLIA